MKRVEQPGMETRGQARIGGQRLRLLVYLALTMMAFVLLAAGLSELELKTGEILFAPLEDMEIKEYKGASSETGPTMPTSPQAIISMLSAVAFVVAAYAAYRNRQIRTSFIIVVLFALLFMGISQLYENVYEFDPEAAEEETEEPLPEQERLPEELFDNPPDLVETVSVATTATIIVVVAIVAWLAWRNRDWLLHRKPPLEIITDEVSAALSDLRAGANFKDTITRCYFDMGQALRKGLGLIRQDGMTPREFEEVLEQAGLPASSVQQLTRLFEKVRYGGQVASDQEKQEAMISLEAILAAAERRNSGSTLQMRDSVSTS